MIESLTVTFQCHRQRFIKLGKVTVLVGDNDAGKSAILRALRWVTLNEWEGEKDTFIPWEEKVAVVKIEVDGREVCRNKGGEINSYFLDQDYFPNFGTKVPEVISKFLNLSPVNFQEQQDPAFWLMLSSGDVAAALNEIFNLTAIDTTMSSIASDLRQARSRLSLCEERLETAKQNKQELDWTVEANKQLKNIETLWQRILADEEEENLLQEQIEKIEETSRRLAEYDRVREVNADRVRSLERVIEAGERLHRLDAEISKLLTLIEMEEKLWQLSKTLKSKQDKLKQWLQGKCPLCEK